MNTHCRFEFICFFANIIEKLFLMSSRYKKFKEAEFFNELTCFRVLSLRVYLLFSKYYREEFFNEFSIQKFKEAKFFYSNRLVLLLRFSIQKIQRGKIFLLELTQSLRVYLLFCKYYREEFFNEFSIQKFKEVEFFNELTGFIVAVLDTKIQRDRIFTRTDWVLLLDFSIQKFKEANFF